MTVCSVHKVNIHVIYPSLEWRLRVLPFINHAWVDMIWLRSRSVVCFWGTMALMTHLILSFPRSDTDVLYPLRYIVKSRSCELPGKSHHLTLHATLMEFLMLSFSPHIMKIWPILLEKTFRCSFSSLSSRDLQHAPTFHSTPATDSYTSCLWTTSSCKTMILA